MFKHNHCGRYCQLWRLIGGSGCVIICKKIITTMLCISYLDGSTALAWFYNIFIIPYYMKFCNINSAIFKNPDLVAL